MKRWQHALGLVSLLWLGAAPAHAEGLGEERARALSADPSAGVFGLMYRGSVRARLGATLPLVGAEGAPGFVLAAVPLVELHEPNASSQPLPSEYWRARLAIETGYGWQRDRASYGVGLALEHESDHESAHAYSRPGFLTQNDVAGLVRATWALGALRLMAATKLRLYVVSCTRDRTHCRNFEGDRSGGAQMDVVLDAPSAGLAWLHPFASLHGYGVLPSGVVRCESHLEGHAGLWFATRACLMQLFLLVYAGNDVGITRAERVFEPGVGFSLSLITPS